VLFKQLLDIHAVDLQTVYLAIVYLNVCKVAGRFTKEVDERVNDFNSSISFDARMYRYDIEGSMAHAIVHDRAAKSRVAEIYAQELCVYHIHICKVAFFHADVVEMCLVHINVIENGFLKIYVRELCSAEVYVLKRGVRQAVIRDLDLLVYCRLKNAVVI